MDFYAILDQVIAILRQRQRVTYRALKVQFQLDDEAIEALKEEVIEAQHLAADEAGRILVWTGDAGPMPLTTSVPARPQDHVPLTYTPPYLAEKILTSRSALEGERKQVTVLFADLKGSTELIADLDPEAAQSLLDPALQRMMDAVHHYEGTVNQVLGDGIMALFGAPVAHEDHAIRACYAALAMQAVMRRYAGRSGGPTAWRYRRAWGSTRGKSWCGRLATTYTWTIPLSARPRTWRPVWSSSPPRAVSG
jgi:Adenylate and Guanylate cyclase catalytic domain